MGLWRRLFGNPAVPPPAAEADEERPLFASEDIPNALDLGWYWSEQAGQFQMAKIDDRDRATHCYVIGASGTGKTKFLEFLIQQDIEKRNGFGVIDPHGDLIEEIKGLLACRFLALADYEEVAKRTVIVDPTDPSSTVTFNPLERLPTVGVPEQVAELVSSFRKIWSDSWGIRMEDLMRNSLIALGEAGLTLLELPPFLTNRAFRRTVLERVTHPIALDYFRTRFDTLTDRAQVTWIEPVMNKINAFLSDGRIRQMFSSERSSFNIREVMDEGRMLLVKLDKGKLKDSSDLLGSLIMAKIMMAAFSRSDVTPSKRRPFYLYIDEFQNFATDSFSTVLSEARKYGLSLVMAHQTFAQIPEELRSLILGNAGIQVCFRVNRHDAAALAKEAFQYSGFEVKAMSANKPKYWSFAEEWERKTEDVRDLPPRRCFVKHKIRGGLIELETVEMVAATDVLGMGEDEYHEFLHTIPFGESYLVPRAALTAREGERVAQTAAEPGSQSVPPSRGRKQPVRVAPPALPPPREPELRAPSADSSTASVPEPPPEPVVVEASELASQPGVGLAALAEAAPAVSSPEPGADTAKGRGTVPELAPSAVPGPDLGSIEPAIAARGDPKPRSKRVSTPKKLSIVESRSPGRGGAQHKYLQALIKKMAEDRGFKATVEQAVTKGGLVDVGVERDGHRIACEITLTTPASHELANVEKCLTAGYHEVIVCSPEKRTLDRARALILDKLAAGDRDRVHFMKPEDLLFYLDTHTIRRQNREERVKGYKVKVKYQPVGDDAAQAAKREAVAQVIARTFRKIK